MGRPKIGKPMGLRLTPETRSQLDTISRLTGRPVSDLVRRAVAEYLREFNHGEGSDND